MEIISEAKFVRMSTRKVRLVANAISKFAPNVALTQLTLMPKRAAKPIAKALKSALANATENNKASSDKLRIKEIIVNEGARLKRFRPGARGRTRPYVKRSSHIRIVLTDDKSQTKGAAWDKK